VIEELFRLKFLWSHGDRKQVKYKKGKLSHRLFFHRTWHMDWRRINPGPPQWEAGS